MKTGCLSFFIAIVLVSIYLLFTMEPYKAKSFNNLSNKEMSDFLKWQDKENSNARDNDSFFK